MHHCLSAGDRCGSWLARRHLGTGAAEGNADDCEFEAATLHRYLGIQLLLRRLLRINAPRASRRVEAAKLPLRDTRVEPNFFLGRGIGEAANRRQYAPARHSARVMM